MSARISRELPGWARPVPDSAPDHRVVVCPTCGEAMSWRQYLEHGPTCPDPEAA